MLWPAGAPIPGHMLNPLTDWGTNPGSRFLRPDVGSSSREDGKGRKGRRKQWMKHKLEMKEEKSGYQDDDEACKKKRNWESRWWQSPIGEETKGKKKPKQKDTRTKVVEKSANSKKGRRKPDYGRCEFKKNT